MPFRKILLQQSDSFFIQTFIGCLIWFPVFACPRMVLLILGYNNVQTGSSTLITNSYSAYPENLKCKSSDYQGLSHTEPKTSQWLPDLCGEMFIAWLPWLAFARWNVIKKNLFVIALFTSSLLHLPVVSMEDAHWCIQTLASYFYFED